MRREGPVAEPLSREERERIAEIIHPGHFGHVSDVERYEATVQALEAERDRLRAALTTIAAATGTWQSDVAKDALAPDPPAGT
jgi:hypothetical protein